MGAGKGSSLAALAPRLREVIGTGHSEGGLEEVERAVPTVDGCQRFYAR
jgi:hypothetical protein